MSGSRYRELISNTLVFTLGSLGSKLILFFLVPLYTNNMTPEEYGIADLLTTTTSFVVPVITLSVQDAVFRFALDKSVDKRAILKCFYLVVVISSVIVGAVSTLFRWISYLSGYELVFVLLTVLTIVRDSYALFVKASDRTRLFAVDAILYVLFLFGANYLLLISYNLGVFGYLYSIVFAKVASLLFLYCLSGLPTVVVPIHIDKTLLNAMLGYSAPLVLNSVSWWIMNYADRYLVGFFLGASGIGIFAVATKMPSLISTFVSIFNQSWTITSVKEFEGTRNVRLYENVYSFFSLFVTMITAGVLLFIDPFMKVYVGEGFREATSSVPFLLLGAYYLAYASFFGILFSSAKQSKKLMSSSIYGAVANILFALIAIPRLGVLGASIATALGYFVTFAYRYFASKSLISFPVNEKRFVVNSILLVLLCSLQSLQDSNWFALLALALLIGVCNIGDLVRFASKVKTAIPRLNK